MFMERSEKQEGQLFDTEIKTDKLESNVKSEESEQTITGIVEEQDWRIKQNEKEEQQYSRKWNLQVLKVPEVCAIFSHNVGVATNASDIKVAHWTEKHSTSK